MSRSALSLVKQRKRKKLFVRLVFVSFVLFLLFCISSFVLFNSNKFKIQSVNISGVSEHQKNLLLAEVARIMSTKKLAIIPQDRIFSFPVKNVQKNIVKKFLKLKDIEINRDSVDILISATERRPLVILCKEETKNCFFVDNTGFIYSEAPFFSAGIFIKLIDNRPIKPEQGKFLLSKEKFQNMLSFKNLLDNFFTVEKIYLDVDNVYKFYFENESYVIVSGDDNWENISNNFNIFYNDSIKNKKQNFEYIDLRFGNKVYYKIKQ